MQWCYEVVNIEPFQSFLPILRIYSEDNGIQVKFNANLQHKRWLSCLPRRRPLSIGPLPPWNTGPTSNTYRHYTIQCVIIIGLFTSICSRLIFALYLFIIAWSILTRHIILEVYTYTLTADSLSMRSTRAVSSYSTIYSLAELWILR